MFICQTFNLGHCSIFKELLSNPKWQAYVGPMLAQRNAPNATQSCYNNSPVYIGPALVNVVFSTNFFQIQSGRHTLVQCWPKVMHPTQLSHVKKKSPVYIGPTLDQRSILNKLSSKTKVACIRWSNVGPT